MAEGGEVAGVFFGGFFLVVEAEFVGGFDGQSAGVASGFGVDGEHVCSFLVECCLPSRYASSLTYVLTYGKTYVRPYALAYVRGLWPPPVVLLVPVVSVWGVGVHFSCFHLRHVVPAPACGGGQESVE